ncbi:ABC transporter substrate-binding protein [Nonomuraea thailandensis]
MTGFGAFGREAYVYVAQEKGFFREAGIEVTVQPGQGSGENLAAVLGGRAQFAAVDFTATLISAAGARRRARSRWRRCTSARWPRSWRWTAAGSAGRRTWRARPSPTPRRR